MQFLHFRKTFNLKQNLVKIVLLINQNSLFKLLLNNCYNIQIEIAALTIYNQIQMVIIINPNFLELLKI